MTVDPFLLRGAALGAAWRAERGGAAGAVYHAVGGGPLPIASGLPVVVTLLDLAPWELPGRVPALARQPVRPAPAGQLLREAAAVIVGTEATARAARRLLRIRRDRLRVVPLAPRGRRSRPAPTAGGDRRPPRAAPAERLGLTERYLVFTGRFDARQDLATLLQALAALAAAGRPAGLADDVAVAAARPARRREPGRSCLARPGRRAARRRRGARLRAGPGRSTDLAGLVRGARAVILPVVSEAAGLPVIEALACGTPVVASAVGPLPEIVGPAGLLVEPRDPDRLAVALRDDLGRRRASTTRLARERPRARRGRRRTLGRRGRARRGPSTPRSASGATDAR